MDDRLATFARVLAFTGFFGLVGAAFGGLVGHLAWKRGRPAGSAVGLGVARAFARVARSEASAGRTGTLVGAVDGLLFLGFSGAVLGLLAARGHVGWVALGHAAFGFLILTGGAVFFGGMALGLVYAGVRAIAGVFAAGVLGAAGGALIGHADGLVVGAVAGILTGTLLGVAVRDW